MTSQTNSAAGDRIPVVALDPHGTDHQGEAARLRELGPVVKVLLPGDVMAWSVTEHALLNEMITDPRFSKDWRNWNAIIRDEITDGWPLIGMVKVTNMVTSDGQEHRFYCANSSPRPSPRAGSRPCVPASSRSWTICWTSCPRTPERTAASTSAGTSRTPCRCRSSASCSGFRRTSVLVFRS